MSETVDGLDTIDDVCPICGGIINSDTETCPDCGYSAEATDEDEDDVEEDDDPEKGD